MSKENCEFNFLDNEQTLPEVKHESAEGVQSWPEVKVEITKRKEENDCIENRIDDISFEGEGDSKKKTNPEIIESVGESLEAENWFLNNKWREKGLPREQVVFKVNNREINLYNFNKEIDLTNEHMEKMEKAFEKMTKVFPKSLDSIKYILINDFQQSSISGNDKDYPLSGITENRETFVIMPRAMDLKVEHRIKGISDLEGTIVHETGHFNRNKFIKEWYKKFEWKDFDEKYWEKRKGPNGEIQYWNRESGEMAPGSEVYPVNPEQCITKYARKNPEEDICDSLVAYIYNPQALEAISSEKLEILKEKEKEEKKGEVRVSSEKFTGKEVKLPKFKETYRIYVNEGKDIDK